MRLDTLYTEDRIALGSNVVFALVSAAPEEYVREVFRQLWLWILTFEQRCSRFLPDSELSQLNRSAGIRMPITSEFRDALLAAKRMSDQTEGLFNPFILPALQRAGYVKSFVKAYADDPVDDYSNRAVVRGEALEVGDSWASIPHGTALDLGGCGKGYAGDMLAGIVRQFEEIDGYCFSVGGDVATGGIAPDSRPWEIQIEGAVGRRPVAGVVKLPDESAAAVASSSTHFRGGGIGRDAWHHIIDPRSLKPATTDVVNATVYADSLLEADVLASCAIVIGSKDAEAYVRSHGRTVHGMLLQARHPSGRWFTKSFGINNIGQQKR